MEHFVAVRTDWSKIFHWIDLVNSALLGCEGSQVVYVDVSLTDNPISF